MKYRLAIIHPRAVSICVRAALGIALPLPRYGLVPA